MKNTSRTALAFGVIALLLFVVGIAFVGAVISDVAPQTSSPITAATTASTADPFVTVVPEGVANTTPKVLDTDPVRGAADPQVTIIEFGDLQCEACARMNSVLNQIMATYADRVQHVWKDYPLPNSHPQAATAANAARCAGAQGLFWEYHDQLFVNQGLLGVQDYAGFGTALGLDATAFTSCLQAETYNRDVLQGYFAARSLSLDSTPSYYINDQKIEGERSYEEMAGLIEQALAE